jgi:hypothetical protein
VGAVVYTYAEELRDCGEEQIGANRDGWIEIEEEHQQGRHKRAAPYTGKSNQCTNQDSSSDMRYSHGAGSVIERLLVGEVGASMILKTALAGLNMAHLPKIALAFEFLSARPDGARA